MSLLNVSVEIPDLSGEEIEAFEKARHALRERLADLPPSDWNLSTNDQVLLLTTLTAPRLPADAIEEFKRVVTALQELEVRHAKSLRQLQLGNRLMFWVGLCLSATFTAAFAAGGDLTSLLQAIIWGAHFAAQIWLRRREPPTPPQGAKQ